MKQWIGQMDTGVCGPSAGLFHQLSLILSDTREEMGNKKTHIYSLDANITYDFARLPEHIWVLRQFSSHLQQDHPEIYDEFLKTLERKLRPLDSTPPAGWESSRIPGLKDVVRDCSKLEKMYFWYAFNLLKIPQDHSAESVELLPTTHLKYAKYPFYYRIQALCEVMGKDQAIAYLKDYDKRTYQQVEPNLYFEDVNHLWDTHARGQVLPAGSIQHRFHRDKIVMQVENCSWYQVMRPFDDLELSYLVWC